MEITLNGKKESISDKSLLQDIVQKTLGDKTKGIAVAVNQQVIGKSDWPSTVIQEGDQVLIIRATQGG